MDTQRIQCASSNFIQLWVFCLGLALTVPLQAAGIYAGPEYFGAWASASANSTSNSSGPSQQSPWGPYPNGQLTGLALANDTNASGSVSAASNASLGSLGGTVTAGGTAGCGGNFQQPCINASSYTEFYDQFQVTGAPAGTPVVIRFALSTSGSLEGTGYWSYNATLSDFGSGVSNSDSSGGLVLTVDQDIVKTQSWTSTYYVGTSYGLAGSMSMNVGERNCLPTCSSDTFIILDLGHTSVASATILTPGSFQLVSASGYDYLNPVPVPAAAWLFGSGLLALSGLLRQRAGRS